MEAATTLYGFEVRKNDNRRNAPEQPKSYNIKQLWQRSHEIIGLALQGFKQVEIAEILNIHPATVSNTLNSELGKEKLSDLREKRDEDIVDVSKEIARLSAKALKVYEQIFDTPSGDLELKKKTADTILMEIGGHRAPTKIQSQSLHFHATNKEIEDFKSRGLQAARDSGMLVELNPKGVEGDESTTKTD